MILFVPIVRGIGAPFSAEEIEFFERRIRPVLAEHCYRCHSVSSEKLKGELRLDFRDGHLRGGESLQPAVVPGKPEESRLIEAVRYENPELQMPPKLKLSEDQIADLASWVKRGAPWPEESVVKPAVNSSGFDLNHRRQSHWAWQPIAPRVPPSPGDSKWPANAVDQFILQTLTENNISPTRDADRRSLLRRAYFDLIGLPPSAEELSAFLSDSSSDAYLNAVDDLLARPRFGERWARHWLDLVRYAETLGHEFDYAVPNSWRYRDYVIRAFNEDVPYDFFVREHIAGDLLSSPRRHPSEGFNESVIGTGFYWFGQQTHSPVDVRRNQADVIDNQIDVLTKTFLGLTVACARCHDHKFDAISTRDYYSLYGIMESSRYAQRVIDREDRGGDAMKSLEDLREKTRFLLGASWQRQVAQIEDYLLAAWAALKIPGSGAGDTGPKTSLGANTPLSPSVLDRWVEALKNEEFARVGRPLHVWRELTKSSATSVASRWSDVVADAQQGKEGHLNGSNKTMVTFADFRKEDFQNWFVEGNAFGPKPSAAGELLLSDLGETRIQLLPFGAAHSGALSSRLQGTLRSQSFAITNRYCHMFVSGRSSRINVFIDNFGLIQAPIYGELRQTLDDGQWKWLNIDLGMWQGHQAYIEFSDIPTPDLAGGGARGGYSPKGYLAVSQIVFSDQGEPPVTRSSVRSLLGAAGEAVDSIETLAEAYQKVISGAIDAWVSGRFTGREDLESARLNLLNWLLEEGLLQTPDHETGGGGQARWTSLIERYREVETSLPNPNRVPAMADGTGVNEQVFIRGNPGTLGETVPRRFLEALDGPEPKGFRHGSGRMDLARRMTDPSNPFLARVMVNRVWHHLFGRGIVATPDDFGELGQRPTHPELLDWLAAYFQGEARWSVKKLIRLMVTSRTYRMASYPSDVAAERADPDNLWLHRMPIRRLEGEIIRDAMLSVAGTLDDSMYGPSVPVFLSEFMDGRGRPQKSGPLNGDGRRSLYIEVRRNFLSPMMRTFDAPVPFTTAGRRTVSNVPAQSLILMNDGFVIEQAKAWARSVANAPHLPREDRVQRLYLAAFARPPSPRESSEALEFLDRQRDLRGLSDALGSDLDAWTDLCHVLFNVKEFVFIN